jgi:hypothetical protein
LKKIHPLLTNFQINFHEVTLKVALLDGRTENGPHLSDLLRKNQLLIDMVIYEWNKSTPREV